MRIVTSRKLKFLKSTYQPGPFEWELPAWYQSVYQPGTGRITSLVSVGLPAWYRSGYQPGTCRDTSLVLVGIPAWYLSGYQPGTSRETSLLFVGTPAWYRSGNQPGTDRLTSINSSKEFTAALQFFDSIVNIILNLRRIAQKSLRNIYPYLSVSRSRMRILLTFRVARVGVSIRDSTVHT